MFKFRIYVYIIPCNQCDDFQHPLPLSTPTPLFCIHFHFQHPLPYSASTFTFSTHFHFQHPLPYSASTFHFQYPLPYSASTFTFTFTFNTLFPIQHPLPLLHSIATNSMCCNLLSQLRSASFRALSSSPLAIFL